MSKLPFDLSVSKIARRVGDGRQAPSHMSPAIRDDDLVGVGVDYKVFIMGDYWSPLVKVQESEAGVVAECLRISEGVSGAPCAKTLGLTATPHYRFSLNSVLSISTRAVHAHVMSMVLLSWTGFRSFNTKQCSGLGSAKT